MRTCEIVRVGRGGEIVPNLLSKYYETRGKCVRRVNKRNYWEMTIDWAGHPLYHTVHNPPATSAQLTFITRSSRHSLSSLRVIKRFILYAISIYFYPKTEIYFDPKKDVNAKVTYQIWLSHFQHVDSPEESEREREKSQSLNEILRHLPLALAGFKPSRRGTSSSRRSVRKLSV